MSEVDEDLSRRCARMSLDDSSSAMRSGGFIGSITGYTPGTNFKYYQDRLKQFFIAHDVPVEKKVPTFLACIGEEIYTTCTSLCAPMLPSEKNFGELMTLLEQHYDKKINKRAQRFKFFNEKQQEGQSISDYILTLKTLAATCEFGAYIPDTNPRKGALRSLALEDALTDQVIVGLANEKIQQRLCTRHTGGPSLFYRFCYTKFRNFPLHDFHEFGNNIIAQHQLIDLFFHPALVDDTQ